MVLLINRRVPGRGTEHPRAFALAPGGDFRRFVPTTMAIRAGNRMATPNGRRYLSICASAGSNSIAPPAGDLRHDVFHISGSVQG
jgi:hypothetical protein